MRALLRADLAALANALRLSEGRRALLARLAGSALLALGTFTIGGRLLLSGPVRAALAQERDVAAPRWMMVVSLGALGLALWSAFGVARALLFGERRAELLLTAPIPRTAIVVHAWTRALAATVALACVLALPLFLGLAARTPASPLAALLFPVVAAVAAAPPVAAVLLGVVLARRFLSDPRLRVLLNVAGAACGFATMLAVGAGLVAGGSERRALARVLSATGDPPEWLDAPGRLLAGAAWGLPAEDALATLLLVGLTAAPPLCLAALLHGAAYEASLSLRARARRLVPRARRWPRAVWRSVARKDLLVTLQTRSSFAGLGFLGLAALLFLSSELFEQQRGRFEGAHEQAGLFLGLVSVWVLLSMLLATLQGGGFFADEGKRLELLATAPIARAALLAGKLPALVVPYAWVLFVLLVGAPSIRGVELGTAALFASAALPATALSLGVLVALGSLPILQRGEPTVVKFLAVALGVMLPNVALLVGLVELRDALRSALASRPEGSWLAPPLALFLGALWAAGAAALALGWALALRNVERMLGPRV